MALGPVQMNGCNLCTDASGMAHARRDVASISTATDCAVATQQSF